MRHKISLIIPVYNVEKYLAECLDSCINQTLRDIEIICVNDCSTDTSAIILKEYAEKDCRVRIVSHEKNKGLGAARNTGIANATGEYVWFIDSDDFIDLISCQILYDTAHQHDVDILCFEGINFYDVGNDDGNHFDKKYFESGYFTDWQKNKNINPKINGNDLLGNFPVSACMYISKREFLKEFSFRESCYFEDTDFTPILFASCSSLRCICFTAYHRRVRAGSITQTEITQKKLNDKKAVVSSLKKYIGEHKIPNIHFLYRFYVGYRNYVENEARNFESAEEYGRDYKSKSIISIKKMCKYAVYFLLKIVKCFLPYGVVAALRRWKTNY